MINPRWHPDVEKQLQVIFLYIVIIVSYVKIEWIDYQQLPTIILPHIRLYVSWSNSNPDFLFECVYQQIHNNIIHYGKYNLKSS